MEDVFKEGSRHDLADAGENVAHGLEVVHERDGHDLTDGADGFAQGGEHAFGAGFFDGLKDLRTVFEDGLAEDKSVFEPGADLGAEGFELAGFHPAADGGVEVADKRLGGGQHAFADLGHADLDVVHEGGGDALPRGRELRHAAAVLDIEDAEQGLAGAFHAGGGDFADGLHLVAEGELEGVGVALEADADAAEGFGLHACEQADEVGDAALGDGCGVADGAKGGLAGEADVEQADAGLDEFVGLEGRGGSHGHGLAPDAGGFFAGGGDAFDAGAQGLDVAGAGDGGAAECDGAGGGPAKRNRGPAQGSEDGATDLADGGEGAAGGAADAAGAVGEPGDLALDAGVHGEGLLTIDQHALLEIHFRRHGGTRG